MIDIKIEIVDYILYQYEKDFLAKEIEKMGGFIFGGVIERGAILILKNISLEKARKLTYVKNVYANDVCYPSRQSIRESFNGKTSKTQSRRYGPHGLHEYKGRFNPQMPRSLILSNFQDGETIIDPFMGSGTTIIEARDLGFNIVGVELNPLAFLLTKAKKIYEEIPTLGEIRWSSKLKKEDIFDKETRDYLSKWFPEKQLLHLEYILSHLDQLSRDQKIIAQVILSNLLRTHSLQDPDDLRIRRRDCVPDDFDLLSNFKMSFEESSKKHSEWVKEFGLKKKEKITLLNKDSRDITIFLDIKVNGSVSSPPYATALPYVDTYRLSMVALGLIHPREILVKEKELIGSRDVNTTDRKLIDEHIKKMPPKIRRVINHIFTEISKDKNAGFRKKAAPYAFARYYASLLKVLEELFSLEETGAKNLWVIGPNRIKLGSDWYLMETPELVGELAKKVGFKKILIQPVQAYSRYNLHSKNAISKESILFFQK